MKSAQLAFRLVAASAVALSVTALPVAAFAASRGPDWNKGTPIAITLTNDRFVPSRITLKSGQYYILRFRNASSRRHNFSAKKFFDYARVNPRDAGWVSHDDVNLAPGQRASVRIAAPDTPGAVYDFRSTVLVDATKKMRGTIYVR